MLQTLYNRKMERIMKKKTIALVLAMSMVGATLAGCGQSESSTAESTQEAAEETAEAAEETTEEAVEETALEGEDAEIPEEIGDLIPADFLQERTGIDEYEDYNDIVSRLEGENEGFAYISIDGSVAYILAITNEMYTMEDGTNAATSVALYGYNEDGKLVNFGNAFTNSTEEKAPIRCDGTALYMVESTNYNVMKIREDNNLLYNTTYIMVNTDGETLSGFVREDGEYDDSSEDIGISTVDEFNELVKEAEEIAPIHFEKAEYDSYEAIIEELPSEWGYAYINIDGYDGDILAVSNFTYKWDNDENVAITVYLYALNGDKATILGNVLTGGTGYPVRCQDGILYDCGMRQYGEMQVQQDEEGKYVLAHTKLAQLTYAADGTASVTTEGDITASTEDEFYDLLSGADELEVINFELVD